MPESTNGAGLTVFLTGEVGQARINSCSLR
jgi:hypothetical protein